MKIILGSKSPRREELLRMLGYDFEVRSSDADEIVEYTSYDDMVLKIANKKADAIIINNDELLVCADTVVVLGDKVLGKPHSIDEAREMINSLAGKTHVVYTAVVCRYQGKQEEFYETTEVKITNISPQEIEEYIMTDEAYDKAGGYAIQGTFARYIESINGDFYNVMGLPICRLDVTIKKICKVLN